MARLLILSALAGAALTVALAWSVRGEVALAAEPAPERRESQAEVIHAAVMGCAAAGGTWSQGLEDGVLLGRCYPIPNVGTKAVRR